MIPNLLRILTYMNPSDSPDHPASILYHSESSVHKPVTSQEPFFAVSYSKSALIDYVLGCKW